MKNNFQKRVLGYIESQRFTDGMYGRYQYASGCEKATLYSSCYAAATRHLFGEIDSLTAAQRQEWIAYLQSHQDDDGLFRDPVIFGEGWYKDDPLTCGRSHLTTHVIIALTALGAEPVKPLLWVDKFCDHNYLLKWLSQRNWAERIAWTGNEVMNVGVLLQYARDYQDNDAAGSAVEKMIEWMEGHHLNPETGLWGDMDISDPIQLSHLVQAAYHFWGLWTYDNRPLPYPQQAIDSILKTRNPQNGFGWGVHNQETPYNASACEDIDSIEPLARFTSQTDYRKNDIHSALAEAANWVLSNQNDDGGFVFMRGLPFEYGHPQMSAWRDQSGMFPTWFRTLSLGYIAKALSGGQIGQYEWSFCRCPGYQHWEKDNV